MDVMQAAAVSAVMVIVLGPTVGLPVLLNIRDRRQERVLTAIARALGSRDLRGRCAIEVACGLVSRRGTVTVYFCATTLEESMELLGRLCHHLPPGLFLIVDATTQQRLAVVTGSGAGGRLAYPRNVRRSTGLAIIREVKR